jgi:hypothetical protein
MVRSGHHAVGLNFHKLSRTQSIWCRILGIQPRTRPLVTTKDRASVCGNGFPRIHSRPMTEHITVFVIAQSKIVYASGQG